MSLVQLVSQPHDVADSDNRRLGFFTDPPIGAQVAVQWEDGDISHTLIVWDSPGAAGDFAEHRVMPLIQAGEIEAVHPGRPVVRNLFIRPEGG